MVFSGALAIAMAVTLAAAFMGATGSVSIAADEPAKNAARRVKPPKFDARGVSKVFFPDVFAMLNGERPTAGSAGPMRGSTPGGPATPMESGQPESGVWDSIISAPSVEDEVKALRVALNESITTPTNFAGKGHKAARRHFALLTVLFWTIEHYGGQVRWKDDARAARQKFGSVTGNAKAGGNAQTYTQAKQSRDLLDQLIRGERPGIEASDDDVEWESVAPRRPLMTLLEKRFEADLKTWTRDEAAVKSNAEDLLREAELVAMIAEFFKADGMPDADDDEYRKYSDQMKEGALQIVQGIKQNDAGTAQKGVSLVSRSCANCHDDYR